MICFLCTTIRLVRFIKTVSLACASTGCRSPLPFLCNSSSVHGTEWIKARVRPFTILYPPQVWTLSSGSRPPLLVLGKSPSNILLNERYIFDCAARTFFGFHQSPPLQPASSPSSKLQKQNRTFISELDGRASTRLTEEVKRRRKMGGECVAK